MCEQAADGRGLEGCGWGQSDWQWVQSGKQWGKCSWQGAIGQTRGMQSRCGGNSKGNQEGGVEWGDWVGGEKASSVL